MKSTHLEQDKPDSCQIMQDDLQFETLYRHYIDKVYLKCLSGPTDKTYLKPNEAFSFSALMGLVSSKDPRSVQPD